jgi:hypothetical protein
MQEALSGNGEGFFVGGGTSDVFRIGARAAAVDSRALPLEEKVGSEASGQTKCEL